MKERYIIKVYNAHWTQIRYLMLLGYKFVEKNMEDNYYIIECKEPLISNLDNIKRKCDWICHISKCDNNVNEKNEMISFTSTIVYKKTASFVLNNNGILSESLSDSQSASLEENNSNENEPCN